MNLTVRRYRPEDYSGIVALYKQGALYGGQFDAVRDSPDRLTHRITQDPDAILVAELDGNLVGTVSLIEDGRIAWLFRFAVIEDEHTAAVSAALYNYAAPILHQRGHAEVLVYSPQQQNLEDRYAALGFNKGGTYNCFWRQLQP